MKINIFSKRNLKELIRDPLSLVFGLALPIVLLLLISTMQQNIKVPIFEIDRFAPAMAVFSFSFITLFSGLLIASDRCSSFLSRLFASPMKARDYIIGYSLPLIPLGILQSIACFATGMIFGLDFNANLVLTILLLIPSLFLFIAVGILFGCLFNDKQVSGISSIVVQCAALLSGMWFDLSMIGGTFETICNFLPFVHAVDIAKLSMSGDFSNILPHLAWILGYTIVIFIASIIVFKRKMKN